MGLSRRFLNLIVESRTPGVKSLRCIDLTRQHLFNSTTPQPLNGNGSESEEGLQDSTYWAPAADAGSQKNLKMGRIWLPSPSFNFRAKTSSLKDNHMHCFPIGDRRVICADQSGNCFLADAEMRRLVTMPHLHKPKSVPLSLFVPSANTDDDDHNDGGGILFVMESAPEPEVGCSGQLSHQFEAFIYSKPTPYLSKFWHNKPLPPPPFVCDRKYRENLPKIRSYAVVSGGSHVCISVEGAGSYFLDTASYTWSHEREWTLPFHGKVEYVPELKLWFGFSAKDQSLAAADLTDMDSQPQLVGTWKEVNLPKEWRVSQEDPQIVNLGLGRFCVARFFRTRTLIGDCRDEPSEQNCAVLTGVEVVPSRIHDATGNGENGKVDLQMIAHRSRRYMSNGKDGAISTVF